MADVAAIIMPRAVFSVANPFFWRAPNAVDPSKQLAMKHEKILPVGPKLIQMCKCVKDENSRSGNVRDTYRP